MRSRRATQDQEHHLLHERSKEHGFARVISAWTTDRHEEKSIDSVIQYICMLERTVQVTVLEFPRPEMTTPPTTQSADKKLDDTLVMNHGEAISGRCKLVLLR